MAHHSRQPKPQARALALAICSAAWFFRGAKNTRTAKLTENQMRMMDKLNAQIENTPLRQVFHEIAKVASWNDRTGGTQGIGLDFMAVAELNRHLESYFAPRTAPRFMDNVAGELTQPRASENSTPCKSPSADMRQL